MKKIAVPITSNNVLEDHFGHCAFYEIYTLSDDNEILDVQLLKSEPGCGCKSNIASILSDSGVSLMLSGGIGNGAVNKLNKAGIGVIRGCSGKSADVILQYVQGKISDSGFSCARGEHHHGNGHEHLCNHESKSNKT